MNALVSLVTLPFKLVVQLFSLLVGLAVGIVKLCGRAAALGVGVVLITLGVLMSFTIVGAVVGVPLAVFGAILVFKVAL
jgi:hypothetical protein